MPKAARTAEYDAERLIRFAQLGLGPVAWLIFLAVEAGDTRRPDVLADLGGYHPKSGGRAARDLIRTGVLVRTKDGLRLTPQWTPIH